MNLLNLLFGTTSKNNAIKALPVSEFKNEISNESVQLIDVRTLKEFNSGHIKGAKNIDVFSKNFALEAEKLNKNSPIFLYCQSGMRSRKASKKLANLGFKTISDLKGGYRNWQSQF